MPDFRATIVDVKGKKGTANNPRNGVQVNVVTYSIEAGQELLPFNGRDVVVSMEPLDQQMFAQAQAEATGTNGATTAPAEENAPTPLRRGRSRRRAAQPENAGP